ncbi:MAG TPA: DUF819 family protein [Clostridia bacterium]|nr:DUF819 family protein [Clostridia bacterium]HPQ47626.1 DUF819 family protein [Clostridia bacterium]
MLQIIQVVIIFLIPMLILWASKRHKIIRTLSPILIAYAVGIVWGNIPGIPLDRGLSDLLTQVSVPIAIPLILFSADFIKWLRSAKKTVISFVLMIASAFLAALLAAWVFRGTIDEFAKISGMMIGVYTGGTPNLMAVGLMLDVKKDTLVLVSTCDSILGGAYFLLLISVIKPLLSKILRPFKSLAAAEETEEVIPEFSTLDKKEKTRAIKGVSLALLICIAGLGVSAGIALLLTGNLDVAIVMLGVTSVGVGLSFVKKIKELKYTFDVGQYLILVFSIALGSMVNIKEMLSASPQVLGFVAISMFGAIVFHLIFAIIFKIDVDTAIITSTAGVYGPAFIVPVANAIKNKEVIVAGLTAGLVGYAVGNYLGLLVYGIASLL